MDSLIPSIGDAVSSTASSVGSIIGVGLPFLYYGLAFTLAGLILVFGLRKIKGLFKKVTRR